MPEIAPRVMRKARFALVGLTGVAVSYLLLWIGIDVLGLNASLAYFLQMLVTVELNFLGNHLLTWRDRHGSLAQRWVRFHAARLGLMIPINQVLFVVLERFTGFVAANTVCIALTTVVNWFVNDRWTFRHRPDSSDTGSTRRTVAPLPANPKVSIIVPVRNSAATIADLVASLLAQKHDNLGVIVVGDPDDTSWPALDGVHDPRLHRIAVHLEHTGGVRDANAKRQVGLSYADGDVLALVDSDMSFPPTWLTDALALLAEGYPVVAGDMVSTADGFLATYIDQNRLGSRTPRYSPGYLLTADNYGVRHKPPVTANLLLRRSVYTEVGGPDPAFTNSYEDFEWARRIIDAGYPILSTDRIPGHHVHRTSLRAMLRDYTRAGRGAANYAAKHPHCKLAKARRRQIVLVPLVAALVAAGVAVAATTTVLACTVISAALTLVSYARSRSVAALVYPGVTLLLGLAFWWGFITGSAGVNPPSAPHVRRLTHLERTP